MQKSRMKYVALGMLLSGYFSMAFMIGVTAVPCFIILDLPLLFQVFTTVDDFTSIGATLY